MLSQFEQVVVARVVDHMMGLYSPAPRTITRMWSDAYGCYVQTVVNFVVGADDFCGSESRASDDG